MHLIQILLPLYDNHGKPLPRKYYRRVQAQLTEKFHGLTAYNRAPAEGVWKSGNHTAKDEVIIYEVMVTEVERRWWNRYRVRLEKIFRQQEVIIRRQEIEML